MTPALLLSAPRFFSASRRLGFSLDGCGCCCCCCCCPPAAPTGTATMDAVGGRWTRQIDAAGDTTTDSSAYLDPYVPNGGAAYTTTPPPAHSGAPAALGAPLLAPPAAHGGGSVGVAACEWGWAAGRGWARARCPGGRYPSFCSQSARRRRAPWRWRASTTSRACCP